VRVYLDNCCFNRPFDNQRQTRVRLEAEAKLCIQEYIREGTLELAWSYILDFENTANPFEERRTTISRWRQYATIDVEETALILQEAKALVELGLKAKDALHIACVIAGEYTYFLTTDDDILRRGQDVRGIAFLDPTAFVREMNLGAPTPNYAYAASVPWWRP
jgi:predicted nucleic acid-binding protein